MYTRTMARSAWPVFGAAVAACTLFAGSVAAKDDAVTVSIQVSTQGLDVSQPRGAQKLYWRLQYAARVACTRGNRVGLAPSPSHATVRAGRYTAVRWIMHVAALRRKSGRVI